MLLNLSQQLILSGCWLRFERGHRRLGRFEAALEYFVQALRVDTTSTPLKLSLVRPGFANTEMAAQNDFAMPFILDMDTAVRIIIDGIRKQKAMIDFPRRLSWPLRVLGLFDGVWCRWAAPRMTHVDRYLWKS